MQSLKIHFIRRGLNEIYINCRRIYTDFPPIYDKYLKINPDSYIEKSDKWDDTINSTWYKHIDEFIKEFNVDEEDDDWKDLLRRAITSSPSREWILEQKVKELEKELKELKSQ